jgi:hypothetical protein
MCVLRNGRNAVGLMHGARVCALCDSAPVSRWKEKHPLHDCELLDGCCGRDLDFYTSKVSNGTGRTLTLCEFCFKGEWARLGRCVFEMVKLFQLVLVGCAESIIWSHKQCGGPMLSVALD